MVTLLKDAGHTTFDLPRTTIESLHQRGTACVMRSNVQAGGYSIMPHYTASEEPIVPRTAVGSSASFLTTPEVFQNHLQRQGIAAEYDSLWPRFNMDAILVPAVAHPAPPHGKYVSNAYAAMYNLLDYVAGCVPVTTVSQELDVPSSEWYEHPPHPRIEQDRFPYDWGDKEMKELYEEPEVFDNSPVGVQIVCRRLQEEKLIGILKEIEALLQCHRFTLSNLELQ
jgi:amidase